MSRELETSKLKEGIEIVYCLEQNIHLMQRGIHNLNINIKSLGLERKRACPVKEHNNVSILGVALNSIFPGAVVGGIIGIIDALFFTDGSFLGKIFLAVVSAVGMAIVGGIFGFIIGFIIGIIRKARTKKWIEQKYEDEVKRYKEQTIVDAMVVCSENEQKDFLISQRYILQNRCNKSKEQLRKMYDAIGIDGKFRNIFAVACMHEYLRLGIACTLSGEHGLYMRVIEEKHRENVEKKLDVLFDKLDEIVDNQRIIYSELTDVRDRCDKMINATVSLSRNIDYSNSRLDAIEENTAIAAYEAECARREMQIHNYLTLIG